MYLEQHSYNIKFWHSWMTLIRCWMMHYCQAKEWVKPDPESCRGVLDRTYITCIQKCLINEIPNVQWSCFYEKILLDPEFWSKSREVWSEKLWCWKWKFKPRSTLGLCCGGNCVCRGVYSEVFVCTVLVILLHCFNFVLQVYIIL